MLGYFVNVYNQRAAIRNCPGTPSFGHYDMGLINRINNLAEQLTGTPMFPNQTNSTKLHLRGEKVGVTRVFKDDISAELPQVQAEPWKQYTGDLKYPIRTNRQQNTSSAGDQQLEERELFGKLVDVEIHNNAGGPLKFNWQQMTSEWDKHVDGVTIFRKSVSHEMLNLTVSNN